MSGILVERLGRVLERYANPNVSIPRFLCKLIARRERELTPQVKERFVNVISTRLSRSAREREGQSSSQQLPIIWNSIQLSHTLTDTIFSRSLHIQPWALEQATTAFSMALPLQERWMNFCLLAICNIEHHSGIDGISGSPAHPSGLSDWKIIFALAMLEKTFRQPYTASDLYLQHVLKPLWESWKGSSLPRNGSENPISPIVLVAFWNLAARSKDPWLTGDCMKFSIRWKLWEIKGNSSQVRPDIITRMAESYCIAAISSASTMHHIFSNLGMVPIEDQRWVTIMQNLLFYYFGDGQLLIGHELYHITQRRGIQLSAYVHIFICAQLASYRAFNLAIPLLDIPGLSAKQYGHMLWNILDSVRLNRLQRLDKPFASTLLSHLSNPVVTLPSSHASIRYVLPLLVNSGNVRGVFEVLGRLQPTFTRRSFNRLYDSVLHHRHPKLLSRLCTLAKVPPRRTREQVYVSAYRFLRIRSTAMRFSSPRVRRQHSIIPISATSAFAPASSTKRHVSIHPHRRNNQVRRTVGILRREHQHMNKKALTHMCNSILHMLCVRRHRSNSRSVRRLIHTADQLHVNFGFVQDRVTVNIFVKAIIRWRSAMDINNLKHLFNTLASAGYPVASNWLYATGLPFTTVRSKTPFPLVLPPLPAGYSFKRHTRPLYKMFIKAFFIQNDVDAARRIVGILKDAELADRIEQEARFRARRLGIIKKRNRQKPQTPP